MPLENSEKSGAITLYRQTHSPCFPPLSAHNKYECALVSFAGQLRSKRSPIRVMQPHAQQHTMHPDTYPNPSPRPPAGGVLGLSMPTPQRIRAPYVVPAATDGSSSGGGGRGRGDVGEVLAGDVGYAHVEAGSRLQPEEQVRRRRVCACVF